MGVRLCNGVYSGVAARGVAYDAVYNTSNGGNRYLPTRSCLSRNLGAFEVEEAEGFTVTIVNPT